MSNHYLGTGRDLVLDNVSPEPMTGCWLWTGRVNKDGYGVTSLKGKHYMAHRLAWQELRGNIPQGLCVCHKCDTAECVNPDHLWLGTLKQNNHDMIRKGRQKGARVILKPSDLDEIRDLVKAGMTQHNASKAYRVCSMTVSLIVRRAGRFSDGKG